MTRQAFRHLLYIPQDPSVSDSTVDLIRPLLREQEYRLSSRHYISNDITIIPYGIRRYSAEPSDKSAPHYQGRHLLPNDAADIKAHPCFHGIQWDRLHQQKPPFVPRVKNWADTRYFGEEDSFSDMPDLSSRSSSIVSGEEEEEDCVRIS
jgi:protein-serine/threonine kinase